MTRFVSALLLAALLAAPASAQDLGEIVANDTGDTAWILTASALVLLMTLPGLALFYGGLVRSKNFLSVALQTGAVASIAEHPFDRLARLRFRVTVNTDNRLMSDTTMSLEMLRLVEAFGYGWSDLERFTINAMKSAFISFPERLAIIDEVIKPRYAVLIG